MIVIELNEFSADLFHSATKQMHLPAIERVLAMHWSKTITNDKEERHGLDPWVQWVSIHTGKSSEIHGIQHLGDVPNLNTKQVWEVLSDKGISSGVWGVLNASYANAKNCLFFLPDPWTFSERAHPEELNELLALPRYYSKNYLHVEKSALIGSALRMLRFLFRPKIAFKLIGLVPVFTKTIINHGLNNYALFSLFDVLNAAIFQVYHKNYQPRFSIIFLNSIAHVQHHHWTGDSHLSKQMRCCLALMDRALSLIFKNNIKEDMVIINGLTQVQSIDDNEYLYRQINPSDFLGQAGIKFSHVEQLMTNDAHVFFDSQEDMETAYQALKEATITGRYVFDVKKYHDDSQKLFYQFDYWKRIESDALLLINGKSFPFYDLFEQVVKRSGKHVPRGDIFSSRPIFNDNIQNHEVFDYILNEYACN